MALAIINNHVDYKLYISSDYSLLLIKFVASCALHFMLYPEVGRTMQLVKYTLNHPGEFTHPRIVIVVVFTAHHINLFAEFLNLFMLLYQHTVEHAIIHFVALEIIVEVPHIYMGSLLDDQLKDRLFEDNGHLHVHHSGSSIKFADRDLFNKLGRVWYKF